MQWTEASGSSRSLPFTGGDFRYPQLLIVPFQPATKDDGKDGEG